MLEKPKVTDANQKSKEYLDIKVRNGEANEKLGKFETTLKKRVLAFIEKVPPYAGNPKEVFTWCEKLENHLSNHEWQIIPDEGIKRML